MDVLIMGVLQICANLKASLNPILRWQLFTIKKAFIFVYKKYRIGYKRYIWELWMPTRTIWWNKSFLMYLTLFFCMQSWPNVHMYVGPGTIGLNPLVVTQFFQRSILGWSFVFVFLIHSILYDIFLLILTWKEKNRVWSVLQVAPPMIECATFVLQTFSV